MTCRECGLPDLHCGQGDGFGSCECSRCDCCGGGPNDDCDCRRDWGEHAEDDSDGDDPLCNDTACPWRRARIDTRATAAKTTKELEIEMSMTIGEAGDVNAVLHALLGTQRIGGGPNEDQAVEAAARLADRANRVLSAGLDGAQVRAAWPKRNQPVDRTSPERIKADSEAAIGDAMTEYRRLMGTAAPAPGPDDVALPLSYCDTPTTADPREK